MDCEAFALCENEANRTLPHPILGPVPACDHCFDLLEGDKW